MLHFSFFFLSLSLSSSLLLCLLSLFPLFYILSLISFDLPVLPSFPSLSSSRLPLLSFYLVSLSIISVSIPSLLRYSFFSSHLFLLCLCILILHPFVPPFLTSFFLPVFNILLFFSFCYNLSFSSLFTYFLQTVYFSIPSDFPLIFLLSLFLSYIPVHSTYFPSLFSPSLSFVSPASLPSFHPCLVSPSKLTD